MTERQVFFNEDGQLPKRFKPLTLGQRNVLFHFSEGECQSTIAELLYLSRPRINQITKTLECELGLIKRVQNNPKRPGVRDYSYFYELTPLGKSILKGDLKLDERSFWRLHNHRMKFAVIQQSGAPERDSQRSSGLRSRTGWERSWTMRGATWHKFWWHGDPDFPSVSVTVMPKTLMFYTDAGQQINARTVEQAEQIGWIAIRRAMEWFVTRQQDFGVTFVLEAVGDKVGKLHLGGAINKGGPLDQAMRIPGIWIDESGKGELGERKKEIEMFANDPAATVVEKGILAAIKLPDALADFNEKLNPIGENVLQVQAMLQGSITITQQNENILKFLSKIMDEMQSIRLENAELKKRLGI